MPDSSNGAPRPDDNKEPNPSPEIPGLPRIAPPEGIRSARGLNFDDTVPDENEAPQTSSQVSEIIEDETFSSDASIDPTAYFPQEELGVEPPLGIDTTEDDFESPSSQAEKAAEAERYRVSSLREDTPHDKEIGLMEHLNELRVRLLWCFAAVIVGMGITWTYNQQLQAWFSDPIINVLRKSPIKGTEIPNQLVGKDPMGFFTVAFQFSLVSALVLVMPFIFFQAWRFIEPALTNNERRYTLVLVPFSSILFFMGAGLGFYVSPLFFKFFIQFQPYGVAAMWDYSDSLLILAKMLIVFGLGFQVPIVVIFGIKIGILTREILIQYWRHAVVVIFIASAVLTPTWDPVTLGVCAIPSCLLYALSIWIAKWI
jgi:sec-independent protein translocase protein TatC